MEFGDDIIRRCPDCNVIFAQHTYLSASTHGYVQWTDGCWTSHYLNNSPLIVYCPFCREWKPIDETEELFTLPIAADYRLMPVIEQGFYPFPCPEDIFAFPLKAKDSEGPFLAVDLSKIKKRWSGWASFFPKEAEHRFMIMIKE